MPNTRTADTPAQQEAIEHQLTLAFLGNAKVGVNAALWVAPVVLIMLAGHVNAWALGLWALVVLVLSVYRHLIVLRFIREFAKAPGSVSESYMRRQVWTWTASAVVWAGSLFLYLDRVPLANQFVCLLILVGMGGMAVGVMTPRMDCFRGYVNALVLTASAAIVWRIFLAPIEGSYLYGLLALVWIFWWLLVSVGQRSHDVLRRSFELRTTNTQLIESLLAQTNAAKEAAEIKDRFLAQAAHDLRQPVHALAFYADWLRTEPQLSKDIVPKILQCTDSVHALFDSLFDFARLDAGALHARIQTVDVRELVNQVILPVEHTAAAKGLHIRTRVHDVQVSSDAILLRRVVGNLVSNAVRYTERGGILISTRRRGEHLWLEVWDTGIGIANAEQAKVFDEFYKIRQHGGTEDGFGLGLAIVRRLSHLLGMGLSLKSSPGKGTCIRLVLPLTSSTSAPSGGGSSAPPVRLMEKRGLEQAAAAR
jgi:signal transduction histidine kinase